MSESKRSTSKAGTASKSERSASKTEELPVHKLSKRVVNCAALEALKYKVNLRAVVGACHISGCSKKAKTLLSVWCKMHDELLRREQMRLANVAFRARQKKLKTAKKTKKVSVDKLPSPAMPPKLKAGVVALPTANIVAAS